MVIKKIKFLGYMVAQGQISECLSSIELALESNHAEQASRCVWLACLNPHSYAVALSNMLFWRALHSADWLVPDGIGVVYGSRLLGNSISQRVTGSDIFYGLCKLLNQKGGKSMFFLGSTQSTLQAIQIKMAQDFPNIRIVGTYSPPFKTEFSEEDNCSMINAVNRAQPDILWVGMTSPKQDIWLHQCHALLDVKFAAAIGAVFDFYIGKIPRAPRVLQRIGMEWLYRFYKEPVRLWRRYCVNTPIFIWHVVKAFVIK